jgi:hypothetical protein
VESDGFVTKDFQIQEASNFASVTFKRLMCYTCDKPVKFLADVTEALTAFENQTIAETSDIDQRADILFAAVHPALTRDELTLCR